MAQNVQQFRVFLSSPCDVHEERDIVRELIKEALPYSPFIRGRATFDVVSWDDPYAAPGLDAHLTPQEAIDRKLPKPSECDIVIVILWSRIGTPLPPEMTKEDGSPYQSGTEWEFEDALIAAKKRGAPTMLLYRRTEEPKFGARDTQLQEKLEQFHRVEAFFERLKGKGGSLAATISDYESADTFRNLLRQHLDSVVSDFLGQEFSEEFGVTKTAVDTMLTILKEQQVPPQQLEAKLKEIAERHLELTEKLHTLSKSNDQPEITMRRVQAAKSIEQGDYAQADRLLAEAVDIDRLAIDEQQEELYRRKLSAAATISQQGELENTRLNYYRAAKHFAEAANLVSIADNETGLDYRMKQASALFAQGDEFADTPALLRSVDIYKSILSQLSGEKGDQLQWAATQQRLGNALWALGLRESSQERHRESIQAYRCALKIRTRDRSPLEWAETQNDLGRSLRNLAQAEGKISGLKMAIEAFELALTERRRPILPLEWAETTLNLGNVIWKLGELQDDVECLRKAVATIHLAEEEFSRERSPFGWAATKLNLGLALSTLGERSSDLETLRQASDQFAQAQKEYTRDRLPGHWARAQSSLGRVTRVIGKIEMDPKRLRQAISEQDLALEVILLDRSPGDWARVQNNRGAALRALGRLQRDRAIMEQAVDAHKAALAAIDREHALLPWAYSQEALGSTYQAIAEDFQDEAALRIGIEALNASLKIYQEKKIAPSLERVKRYFADANALLQDMG